MFSHLIFSHKSYSDPLNVIKCVLDDIGNQININEEKDVGEFNLNFIERLKEGLECKAENKVETVNLLDSPVKIDKNLTDLDEG